MPHAHLDKLLAYVAQVGGSDLHMKVGSPPRVRVNGTLARIPGENSLSPADTVEMARAIMRPDIAEHFDKANDVDFAYSNPGVGRFRVNSFRQRGSVAMVFRLVRPNAATMDELGLPDVVRRLSEEQRGLVLVTGPTGSGKTTTLAAMIDHINKNRECHIITIEDPIEVLHSDRQAEVNQREVGVDCASFAGSMRSAMRQDPDVILVGEMRDEETVATALTAAETGHLVLSTLHTIDATETINRIVDFFPSHQQNQIRHTLAGSLKGIICQRLVPTIDGKDRVAAMEVMVANGRVQQCVIDPSLTGMIHEIIQEGEYYGMQSFDQALAKLFAEGRVSLPDAMNTATSPHDLRVRLQQMGLLDASNRPIAGAEPVMNPVSNGGQNGKAPVAFAPPAR